MYANHPDMAKRWSEHTAKNSKLPEYAHQKQAAIGFIKRANYYGFNANDILNLLKYAAGEDIPDAPGNNPTMTPRPVQPPADRGFLDNLANQYTPEKREALKNTFKQVGSDLASGNVGDAISNFGNSWKQHPEFSYGPQIAAAGLAGTSLAAPVTAPLAAPAAIALETAAGVGDTISSFNDNILQPFRQYQQDRRNYKAPTEKTYGAPVQNVGNSTLFPQGQTIQTNTSNLSGATPTQTSNAPSLGNYLKPGQFITDSLPWLKSAKGVNKIIQRGSTLAPSFARAVNDPETANPTSLAVQTVNTFTPGAGSKFFKAGRKTNSLGNSLESNQSSQPYTPPGNLPPYSPVKIPSINNNTSTNKPRQRMPFEG